jgi:hypothetical protein
MAGALAHDYLAGRADPSGELYNKTLESVNIIDHLVRLSAVTRFRSALALQREGLGTISVLRAATYQPVIQAW